MSSHSLHDRLSPGFLLIVAMVPVLLSCAARPDGKGMHVDMRSRPPSGEFRGAWIYDPRQFDPDEVVATLKKAGFNAVFVRLSSAGAAYYPSEVLPQVAGDSRDYAEAYVQAGRRHRVKIHAWHVCFMMHHAPASAIAAALKEGEVMRDTRAHALRPTYNVPVRTPAVASNRDLERKAAVELVTKYDMDGIQLDYIRFFSTAVDYSVSAQRAFEEVLGEKVNRWPSDVTSGRLKDRYHEWKVGLISSVVREVSQAVKEARSGAKVSAAVLHNPEVALRDHAQDWVSWVHDGHLDFVVPMNYTTSNDLLADWIEGQRELVKDRIPMYAGLGAYRLNKAEQLNSQIDICRRLGLPGYVLFTYDDRLKDRFLPHLPND